MPTSPSLRPSTEKRQSRRWFTGLMILIVIIAVLTVAVAALPASLMSRFLPANMGAEDFSGTVWHGSATHLAFNSHDAGALEWHLHPASFASGTLSLDLHWVKVSFVADGHADIDRHALSIRNVRGGGPIEELADFGLPGGLQGASRFNVTAVDLDVADTPGDATSWRIRSAIGEIDVSQLKSLQIANGSDLGAYVLRLGSDAVTSDGDLNVALEDAGGPLELNSSIHFSWKEHTGLLTGTLKERATASPNLRMQLQQLAQLHARDAQGRIPVDLEFTL